MIAQVLKGLKMGIVDFLERPINPLKLQNLWQHTVRKMMAGVKDLSVREASAAAGRSNGASPAGSSDKPLGRVRMLFV